MLIAQHPRTGDQALLASSEAGAAPLRPPALPPSLVAAMREPVLLIAAVEFNLARDVLAVPVPVLAIEHDAATGLVVHAEGGRFPLPAMPPLCVAALAFTEEGEAALRLAIEQAAGGDAVPPVTRMQPGDAMGLATAVVSGTTAVLRRQAALLAGSLRSLGQLRAAHDDHQGRLAQLEAYVARDNRQDFDQVFAEEPAGDEDAAIRLGRGANLGALTQLLPIASRGVSAIALHLEAAPAAPDAVLVVRLTSLEDGQDRAAWRLPAARLSAGWQVLGLERALTGLSRTLRLSVEVPEGTLALSLGGNQPLPAFRVSGEDGAALAPRSLAFRVWTGLPGVMPPVTGIDHAEGADDLGQGWEEVPILPEAIELSRDGATALRRALDDDSLPCDPARAGLTLGRMAGALPAGTLVAQATGRVLGGGEEAVEFALATAATAAEALGLAGQPTPAIGWSGWVMADEDGLAPLRLFQAEGAPARDLFVLTRRMAGAVGTPPRARLGGLRATVAAAQAGKTPDQPPLPSTLAPLVAEADETEVAESFVAARDFRGTGFHALEGGGDRTWRWLGAEVVLKLDNVSRHATRIEVLIAATAPGLTEGAIRCSVNGVPTRANFATTAGAGEAGLTALIPLPQAARRRDRAVVLDIAFGRAHQPPGDSRVLSLACTGLRISA
ncbi:DUF6212 domain-containing protein [Falsiroseomonas ponticola]|uniref:DUF6212 domain-containing protein n=1 Tax=Falsiroseomonas ponticola TaxID=2786951 RepID=UPI0019337699|nr:DUF6212 domain-containing protein [Roseomonas ponticola]